VKELIDMPSTIAKEHALLSSAQEKSENKVNAPVDEKLRAVTEERIKIERLRKILQEMLALVRH